MFKGDIDMKKMIYKGVRKSESGRKCIKCGCDCWRSDVNYCWDCYKYEMYESR